MRRQTTGTAEVLEGEARVLRLDPSALPARVTYSGRDPFGPVAQEAVVSRDSVVIRRESRAGGPLYVSVPLHSYRGVLLRIIDQADGLRVGLWLHHANGELAVPLFGSDDTDDVVAEWRAWGRALDCPLLIENAEGDISEAHRRLGAIAVKHPRARRANRFFADRRPRFLCERRTGGQVHNVIHREVEIIARDVCD